MEYTVGCVTMFPYNFKLPDLGYPKPNDYIHCFIAYNGIYPE